MTFQRFESFLCGTYGVYVLCVVSHEVGVRLELRDVGVCRTGEVAAYEHVGVLQLGKGRFQLVDGLTVALVQCISERG